MPVVAKSGFTLVEILTVTAIVIVLAGLITTVAIRAKASGRGSACASNLEQLGKALCLYTADHDDSVPPFASWDTTTNQSMPENSQQHLMAALKHYGGTDSIWHCPLGSPGWPQQVAWDAVTADEYIVPGATAALMFNDQEGHFAHVPTLSSLPPSAIYLCDPEVRTDSPHFKSPHGEDQANALFFDDHVKVIRKDPG